MKALLNLVHNGQAFTAGDVLDQHLEIVTDEEHQELADQLHLNRNNQPVYHTPTPQDLSPVHGKISTTDLAALIEGGVISMDNNAVLPKGPMGAEDVMDQNRHMWRDDRKRWAKLKADQAADRANNLEPSGAPVEQPSNVVTGTKEDALSADAKAKAALAAQNRSDPIAPADPADPPENPTPPADPAVPAAPQAPAAPENPASDAPTPPADPANKGVQS